MTHDPLCHFTRERLRLASDTLTSEFLKQFIDEHCQCDLIARARADEREKAAQRVKARDMQPICWDVMWFGSKRYRRWAQYGYEWGRRDALRAIAAARGEES